MGSEASKKPPTATDNHQQQEQDMIFQAQTGDQVAMQWLYQRYSRQVYNLALRLLCHQADAQDVMQDSFVKCFKCLYQYRSDAPFWCWLRTIVSTTALMRMRSDKRRGIEVDMEDALHSPELASSLKATQYTQCNELEVALQKLPGLSRMVVWLYHVEGYTHAEVAQLMDRSVSFSKSRLARAHIQLRELLGPSPSESESNTGSVSAHPSPQNHHLNSNVLFEANS